MRDRRAPASLVHRHRHTTGYAAIVLAGDYEEAGFEGRHRVRPGDVLIHHAFDTHLDRIGARGADIYNMSLPPGLVDTSVHAGRIANPDEIVRAAQTDPSGGLALFLERFRPVDHIAQDWPDLLRRTLVDGSERSISDHADVFGLCRETIARGFAKLYGVSPSTFRAEARARRAWRRIAAETVPLAVIAYEEGFSDQAHMTRAIAALTGAPPSHWARHMGSRLPAA